MNDDAREVLLKAADRIAKKGWTQRKLGTEENGYCALGAILAVAHDAHNAFSIEVTAMRRRFAFQDATEALRDYLLRDELTTQYGGISHWNDHPRRTAEDVILGLKRAAEEA